jgi:hypothetical protein
MPRDDFAKGSLRMLAYETAQKFDIGHLYIYSRRAAKADRKNEVNYQGWTRLRSLFCPNTSPLAGLGFLLFV